ncbi:MAG: hypothetical protein MRZ79_11550 [Bacteroidia bacterium]|nr:hypothetical protein [Bacteroidia bacterium]
MKAVKLTLFVLCVFWGMELEAQIIQKPIAKDDTAAMKRVRILNADSLVFRKDEAGAIQRLIGNVKMKQDSSLFFCDSAYFYEDKNLIEAFSNVKVIMSDSVSMYSDRLTYDGNTRIAEVYDNILLTDLKSKLKTDRMTYYRNESYGKFINGGTLKDDESTLTSDRGYYYPDLDKSYFKGNVKLVHPDYVLETDTMGYDTDSKIANFLTYTIITSDDGIIETTSGSYNTDEQKINLIERSTLKDSSYTLDANTIRYNEADNIGIATGDVLVSQEDSSLELRGQFGIFNRDTDESTLTQDPVAIQYMDNDTLYIFADTLEAYKEKIPVAASSTRKKPKIEKARPDSIPGQARPPLDSGKVSQASPILESLDNDSSKIESIAVDSTSKDSLPKEIVLDDIPMDSIERRIFKGHYQVRFFMNEMQGRCDSMVYLYDDSTIYLYKNPVLWSEQGQISGDLIKIWMVNNKIDSMWVGPNAFLVSEADTVGFDQIKGLEFRAKFKNNEIEYLHVIGQAESMYYVKEEDSTGGGTYQGMNEASSQEMTLFFSENELTKILFEAQPQGVYYPIHEVIFKNKTLAGMEWRIDEKPDRPQILAESKAIKEDGIEEIDLLEMEDEEDPENER